MAITKRGWNHYAAVSMLTVASTIAVWSQGGLTALVTGLFTFAGLMHLIDAIDEVMHGKPKQPIE